MPTRPIAFLLTTFLALPLAAQNHATRTDTAPAATADTTAPVADVPKSRVALAPGLGFADAMTIASPKDFLRGFPSRVDADTVNAVVEIPAGTNEKWEVKLDGVMRWDIKNDKPRIVQYLGYPTNYGIIPRAILGKEVGGDGDPLDVLVLGPSHPRGTVVPVRIVGVIRLVDAGEQDDKILTVPLDGPLSEIRDLAQLDAERPGITTILEAWFENYKGAGKLTCGGFGSRQEALELLAKCEKSFALAEQGKPASAPK